MSNTSLIAVTGSRGFLGHHLIKALKKRGFEVLEIDITLGIDILSIESLEKIPSFDTLIHLAAKTYVPDSYTDSIGFYQTNIVGTLNCLEMCKKHKAKIIFASSYVYGEPKHLPVDELHPTRLWNPYATSKIIGEQLCTSYSQDFGVDARILRIFNIYGPGQDSRFLLPTIIKGILNGKLCLESSSPRRDFIYILDVVDAIMCCINSKRKGTHIYNVGFGVSYGVTEIVELVNDILKANVKVSYKDEHRKSEITNVVADISKIKAELDWFPKFDLKTGLQHYIDSYPKEKSE